MIVRNKQLMIICIIRKVFEHGDIKINMMTSMDQFFIILHIE